MKVIFFKKLPAAIFSIYFSLYLILIGGGIPALLAQQQDKRVKDGKTRVQNIQEKRKENPLISSFQGEPKIGKSTYALSSPGKPTPGGGTEELLGPLGNTVSLPQVSRFTGSLSMSVPLALPQGRRGAKPQLVLTYNSNSKTGIAGVGWDINYECITRKTTFGIPHYTSEDIFQYMGEDLVRMPDGTFRTKNESFKRFEQKSYTTETDPYHKHIYWVLIEPDGTKKIFGHSPQSKLTYPPNVDSPVFKWALDEVVDLHGNTVYFHYKYPRAADDDLLLTDVMYPMNIAAKNASYYHVELKYKERYWEPWLGQYKNKEGLTLNYRSGFALAKERYRLEQVIINYVDPSGTPTGANKTMVRKYLLEYGFSQVTFRSLLEQINVVGRKGTRLMYQSFSYNKQYSSNPPKTWFTNPAWPKANTNTFKHLVGDFNGDGLQDVCHVIWMQNTNKSAWRVSLSDGKGFKLQSKPWVITGLHDYPQALYQGVVRVADFDGDGKDDILFYRAYPNTWQVFRSTGSKFKIETWFTGGPRGETFKGGGTVIGYTGSPPEWIPGDLVYTGDFNGDGKADILHYLRGTDIKFPNKGVKKGHRFFWTVMLSVATPYGVQGFRVPEILIEGKANSSSFEVRNEDEIHPGDFNGDGKTDILHYVEHPGNKKWRYWQVIQFNWGYPPGANVKDWAAGETAALDENRQNGDQILIGDFNGDGLHDVAHYDGNKKAAWVMLSNGKNFLSPVVWGSISVDRSQGDEIFTGEIDGDGKTDIVQYNKIGTASQWNYITSNGHAFWSPISAQSSKADVNRKGGDKVFAGDFNGNGKVDILHYEKGKGIWTVYASSGTVVDLLTDITNMVHGSVKITYKPSSKCKNSNLPFIIPVVESIRIRDGIDPNGYRKEAEGIGSDDMYIRYDYQDGMFLFKQRDFRGFRRVQTFSGLSTDKQLVWSETVFHQHDGAQGLVDTLRQGACKPAKSGETTYVMVVNRYGELPYKDRSLYASGWDSTPPYFNPLTKQWRYTYSSSGSTINQKRTLIHYQYDNWGNIIEQRNYGDFDKTDDEKTAVFEYFPNKNKWIPGKLARSTLYQEVGKKGAKFTETRYYYDNNSDWKKPPTKGDLTRIDRWNGGTNFISLNYQYDYYGNVVKLSDATNNLMTISYDDRFNIYPIQRTNPLSQVIQWKYDLQLGVPLEITDRNGNKTIIKYDDLGRKKHIYGAGNPMERKYYYYGFGDRKKSDVATILVTTPTSTAGDSVWQMTHLDGLGRAIQTRKKFNGLGVEETYTTQTYDSQGRIKKVSLPMFGAYGIYDKKLQSPVQPGMSPNDIPWVTYSYDALGRITERKRPDGATTRYNYFLWNTTVIDAEGKKKEFDYDAYQQLWRVKEFNKEYQKAGTGGLYLIVPVIYKTKYEYDIIGKLRKIVDNQNNITAIEYDKLGRKVSMIDPDVGTWTYKWDNNGNIISQTDAQGVAITFENDKLNRLRKKIYPDKTVISYRYDSYDPQDPVTPWSKNAIGRLTRVSDPSGITVLYYDKKGRTVQTIKVIDGKSFKTSWSYNSLGRVSDITYPDNSKLQYKYDENGKLEAIPGYVTSLKYDASGQINTINYANGTQIEYNYDSQTLMPIATTTRDASSILFSVQYQWDKVGNLMATRGDIVQDFKYDDLHRLVWATGFYGEINYEYDSIGNLKKKGDRVYLYKDPQHPHAVTVDGNNRYKYDKNGNMIKRRGSAGTALVSYNGDNLPVKMTMNGHITSFAYDALGNRVKKSVHPAPGREYSDLTKTTYYVGDFVQEADGSTSRYILIGGQRVATLNSKKGVRYYHLDHLGSNQFQTNNKGKGINLFGYKPFGEISTFPFSAPAAGNQPSVSLPFNKTVDLVTKIPQILPGQFFSPKNIPMDRYQYTSQELDYSTGFYFYHARYYDPGLGRFLSADMASPNLHDPQSLNHYSYVLNNPTKYVDPTGHLAWFAWLAIAGAVLAVSGGVTMAVGYATGNETAMAVGSWLIAGGTLMVTAGAAFSGVSVLAPLAQSVLQGELLGMANAVVSAGVAGQDISSAALVGTLIGGAAGAAIYGLGQSPASVLGEWGKSGFGQFTEFILNGATKGAVSGTAMGAVHGYASGTGIGEGMLTGLEVGAVVGALMGGFEFYMNRTGGFEYSLKPDQSSLAEGAKAVGESHEEWSNAFGAAAKALKAAEYGKWLANQFMRLPSILTYGIAVSGALYGVENWDDLYSWLKSNETEVSFGDDFE